MVASRWSLVGGRWSSVFGLWSWMWGGVFRPRRDRGRDALSLDADSPRMRLEEHPDRAIERRTASEPEERRHRVYLGVGVHEQAVGVL
jgi:hypothetical protein